MCCSSFLVGFKTCTLKHNIICLLNFIFRTDKYKPPTRFHDGGRNGRGFKFIITSYSEGKCI